MEAQTLPVSAATTEHFFNQRYLFAFAPQAELMNHLKTQGLEEDELRRQEIFDEWVKLRPQIDNLIQSEQGYAESIDVREIPQEYNNRLIEYASDPLFTRSFSNVPTSFAIVEIDKLIAAQRTVNIDYVNKLIESYPQAPTFDTLLDICLSPKHEIGTVQHLEVAPNTHIFTSPNSDMRFLGSFVKHLTEEDLNYPIGGLPATAIISFIGYGCPSMNAIKVGNRVILNNGFHRVHALRSIGIKEIPLVIQHIHNPQLELPPTIADLQTQYLVSASRPALIKDFFEPGFAITLKVHERVKMVGVGINASQHNVPL